jgi:eukaryotic-like serine/threonine-protein kinase
VVEAKLIDVGSEGRQRIDRYELVAEIASGGMATVFLARLSGVGGFQRFVAIKRLHPHLAGEKEFVRMFLDEARLAAGIHHPNVVPILEVGASERGYYLVMEYIEGDTLARLLARAASSTKRLPVPIGLRIVIDMLAGLHAAHELKDEMGQPAELVHRDVSPQNVLVGTDGISRITDFGVARAASRLTSTRVGQLKGKIAYMAPEQATGQPLIDRRADVFSAGILLWEVLSAKRLFKSENEAATLARVISDEIPRVRPSADINAQVAAVCMKALERNPDKRFSTCAQFADSLERAATASGKVASAREVAAYVSEVIGNEISQAREAVRAWLARSEPSQVAVPTLPAPPSSTVSSAAMELPGEPSRSGVGSYPTVSGVGSVPSAPAPQRARVGWVLGASALLFVGAVGLFLMRHSGSAEGSASPASSSAVAETAPSPTASSSAAQAQTPAASASANSAESPEAGASAQPTPKPKPVVHLRRWPSEYHRGQHRAIHEPTPPAPKPPPKQDNVNLTNPYR